ncbi:MAG: DAK2 domain-containing protein [Dehalococcoidia bacterium]
MTDLSDGRQLRAMFTAATRWLEVNMEAINSLNVFPVPDGDTGTNMLFTMRATMEEAERSPEDSASAVAKAMAWGALMGARGNSGVILSQILRGFSQGLEGRSSFDGKDFAAGLTEAASAAYRAVSKPVEGTILTVMTDAARAAQGAAAERADLEWVLESAVSAAEESVARTQTILPVLREAGVVDAGGQGLLTMLEGALKQLRHESIPSAARLAESQAISRVSRVAEGEGDGGHPVYGFCTEFLIQGRGLELASIREKIGRKGESTVVVGGDSTVRVHTHSFEPDAVIDIARSLGELSKVRVQNIDEQHSNLLEARESAGKLPIATVAVAAGEGLESLFSSLGAAQVVSGGQTMNPSTEELLTAVESVPAAAVVLLPNNKNILPAARQAASLSQKTVEVIPTSSIPQGIASILAFNGEARLEDNLRSMTEALSRVNTLELTRAVRPAKVNGLKIRKGEAIGLLDGELLVSASGPAEVVQSLAPRFQPGGYNLATVYCGAKAPSEEREEVVQSLRNCLPGVEVEVVEGGQRDYEFIISLE